jgi:hypothetical protein
MTTLNQCPARWARSRVAAARADHSILSAQWLELKGPA